MLTLDPTLALEESSPDQAEGILSSVARVARPHFRILSSIIADPSTPLVARTLAARLVPTQLRD